MSSIAILDLVSCSFNVLLILAQQFNGLLVLNCLIVKSERYGKEFMQCFVMVISVLLILLIVIGSFYVIIYTSKPKKNKTNLCIKWNFCILCNIDMVNCKLISVVDRLAIVTMGIIEDEYL